MKSWFITHGPEEDELEKKTQAILGVFYPVSRAEHTVFWFMFGYRARDVLADWWRVTP